MNSRKQHDPDVFIDRVMRAFWLGGYEGTSLADLVSATGVNRGSIYSNYSNKRDLFRSALRHYDDRHRARFLAKLSAELDPAAAIIAAFESASRAPQDDAPAGCLLVNTAIEVAPHDADIAEQVAESLDAVLAFFEGRLAAMGHGSPEPTSKALLGLFLGLRVLTRAGAQDATRGAIVEQARELLR